MQYVSRYRSPLGAMLLAADDAGLTGAWFEGQKYFARGLDRAGKAGTFPFFPPPDSGWTAIFPAGIPAPSRPAPDRNGVPEGGLDPSPGHPPGLTTTYGALAEQLARRMGLAHMSAQAVGGAVGRNPISILVPATGWWAAAAA